MQYMVRSGGTLCGWILDAVAHGHTVMRTVWLRGIHPQMLTRLIKNECCEKLQ